MSTNCEIVDLPLQPVLSARLRSPVQDLPAHFGRIYSALFPYLAELGEPPAGMPYAAYYNMDMQDLDIGIGVPVGRALPGQGELQPGSIPAGRFVQTEHVGLYDAMQPAYAALAAFAAAEGLTPTGVAYEYYLNDPSQGNEPARTLIMYPVTNG